MKQREKNKETHRNFQIDSPICNSYFYYVPKCILAVFVEYCVGRVEEVGEASV